MELWFVEYNIGYLTDEAFLTLEDAAEFARAKSRKTKKTAIITKATFDPTPENIVALINRWDDSPVVHVDPSIFSIQITETVYGDD